MPLLPLLFTTTIAVLPTAPPAPPMEFTYSELASLIDEVKPLLDLIASGEGNYNSVNRGRAGDSPGDWAKVHLGKSITEMTLAEVRGHQGGRTAECWYKGKKGDANLFAVGRYQLIPCTLKYATESIEDLSMRQHYSPEVQDAMAVFLLFVKRPIVGGYLLGEHDNYEEAGQELAKEFASIPIQYPHAKCNRGQSYYCGDRAGNKAHIELDDVEKAMKSVRKSLAKKDTVQKMVTQKKSTTGRIHRWWHNLWHNHPPIEEVPLVDSMTHTLFEYIQPPKPLIQVPTEPAPAEPLSQPPLEEIPNMEKTIEEVQTPTPSNDAPDVPEETPSEEVDDPRILPTP